MILMEPSSGLRPRVIVGVTGASGAQYAIDLLETLHPLPVETQLVISEGAKRVLAEELKMNAKDFAELADAVHDDRDVGAGIASGSYRTLGMVVVPCSASTLAKIAHGLADTLITRAAHVHLKERRKLILVPRETPYSRPMLEAMLKAHDAGAHILAANPGFYGKPKDVSDLLGFITARVLDNLGIENTRAPRWKDVDE
jgi:4-hydroxy-3-polyprenylbenzoate decarboxylase